MQQGKPYISGIDNLRQWFFENSQTRGGATSWKLYANFLETFAGNGRHPVAVNDDNDLAVDDSWEKLENVIQAMTNTGGEKFTLYLPKKWDNKRGKDQQLKTHYLSQNSYSMGMQQDKSLIDLHVQNAMLRRDVEDLAQAQQSQNSSIGTQVINKLIEETDFSELIGLGVAFLKQKVNTPQIGAKASQETQVNPQVIQILNNYVGRFLNHFDDPNDFIVWLDNLCDRMDENPDTIKQIAYE